MFLIVGILGMSIKWRKDELLAQEYRLVARKKFQPLSSLLSQELPIANQQLTTAYLKLDFEWLLSEREIRKSREEGEWFDPTANVEI